MRKSVGCRFFALPFLSARAYSGPDCPDRDSNPDRGSSPDRGMSPGPGLKNGLPRSRFEG